MQDTLNKRNPHRLLRFEVQVAEHCNLNCCNCMHFSPIAKPDFLDIKEYERDLKRLSELFDGKVEWIRLMGGEPLLNQNLPKIMCLTRQYFPHGKIMIVTNGILLSTQTESFYKLCKENSIDISVTVYPIRIDYKKIAEEVSKRGVSIEFYGQGTKRKPTMWRHTIDLKNDLNPEINFQYCKGGNECISLRHGRLYTCATAAHAHHLKRFFNLKIHLSEEDSIDIYKAKSSEEIMRFLAEPIPFCKNCDFSKRDDYEDDWTVSKKDIYEWVNFSFSTWDFDYLKKYKDIYIYGAGNWGLKTYEILNSEDILVKSFLVTSINSNKKKIKGIPVVQIDSINDIGDESVCIIAIDGKDKIEVQHRLRKKGFKFIIPLFYEPREM